VLKLIPYMFLAIPVAQTQTALAAAGEQDQQLGLLLLLTSYINTIGHSKTGYTML
jgi:hypothetical protein